MSGQNKGRIILNIQVDLKKIFLLKTLCTMVLLREKNMGLTVLLFISILALSNQHKASLH